MPAVSDLEPSTYLTDGLGLYRVVRADEKAGTVLLEDCSCPDGPLLAHRVGGLAADGFQVVRRESDRATG